MIGGKKMSNITMEDLFQAIKEVSNQVKKLDTRVGNVESKVTNIEAELKETRSEMGGMKDELKQDIRKVDQKFTILSDDILNAKADIAILKKQAK